MRTATLPLAVCLAFATACQAHASAPLVAKKQEAAETTPDIAAKGFVPLFNGTDLAGWKRVNGTARYEWKDGAVVGTCVPGSPNTFLRTERADYKDFVLTFEMKFAVKGNSGVQFRSAQVQPGDAGKYWSTARDGRVYGYQCEMDPSPRAWTCGLMEEGRRGWLQNVAGDGKANKPGDAKAVARAALEKNGWNRVIIKAEGRRVQTWLNGVPVTDYTDAAPEALAQGFFALQVHSGKEGEIHWRDLRVMELNK